MMTGFLPRGEVAGEYRQRRRRTAIASPGAVRPRSPRQGIRFADLAELVARLPLALNRIDTLETFQSISTLAGDLVANGRVAKFLIDRRNPATPAVRFVNGGFEEDGRIPEAAKYHYHFGRAVFGISESLDAFNALTYFTEDKRYIAGSIRTYLLEGADEPVFGLQFYPQDLIRERSDRRGAAGWCAPRSASRIRDSPSSPRARSRRRRRSRTISPGSRWR